MALASMAETLIFLFHVFRCFRSPSGLGRLRGTIRALNFAKKYNIVRIGCLD
jgi:hypothetical protein